MEISFLVSYVVWDLVQCLFGKVCNGGGDFLNYIWDSLVVGNMVVSSSVGIDEDGLFSFKLIADGNKVCFFAPGILRSEITAFRRVLKIRASVTLRHCMVQKWLGYA